ncbi:hypothetical protein HMI54_011952 [Coelomomyces lativittatus]|nr:hypothetical protein HMI56_000422 [Coelomomyces lativittatus]KAJ1515648.1 hypothetical protein HMI54_011952 [Coelomomyces lativittatus]
MYSKISKCAIFLGFLVLFLNLESRGEYIGTQKQDSNSNCACTCPYVGTANDVRGINSLSDFNSRSNNVPGTNDVPPNTVPVNNDVEVNPIPVNNDVPTNPIPVNNDVPANPIPVNNDVPANPVAVNNDVPVNPVAVNNDVPANTVPVNNNVPPNTVPVNSDVAVNPVIPQSDVGKNDQMTLEATQLLQEMATFSKVFLASNIKDNLEASSPAGLYLALGRFIHLAQIGSPSYQELKEDWKINPDKTSPQRLAAFDTYLGNNQINSVNLFYQPLSYKDKSPELTKALSASNTIFVHNQGDLNMIVNEKTKGGIKEVKLPTDIENTQVLYNILSFKFIWYINFVREEELSDFVVNRGERLKVSYMSTLENFVTTATNDYKAAKLDFIKDPNAINKEPLEDFSAYLVRLKSGKPLHEIWEEVHQKLSQEEKIKIRIKLPAFRTEQETEFESTMFPKLLQERNNDFPIIAKAASTDSLKIKMKQKTFVCVDEKGSVGGGVTSVHGGNFAAGPRTLEFNEAFYYIIAGNKVATPLFVSYVTKGMTDLKESCT